MSDLISKEEVLNLIDTAFECGAFDGRYAYENLIDAVQNLIRPLETDLVRRQAVIDTLETDCSWDIFNEWGSRTPTGERIIEAIKRVPSVEPERKTGHWEYTQDDYDPNVGNWHCSECKDIVVKCLTKVAEGRIPRYKYCSNCGCRMIEPQGKCRQDMSDLINRQSAIDAFERFIHELGIKDEPYNYGEMALSVQNVPSVTPHMIHTEASQGWIPVMERLPEVGSEVLVCFDFKGHRSVHIANFYSDGKFHGFDDDYLTPEARKHRKTVAWMPLPQSYKEESEEQQWQI